MDDLVSTDWLAQNLGHADVVVVDSSWHMPATNRSGREEYLASHIPGARFLDIDAVADMTNPAPHMLPSAEEFGAAMEALGIGEIAVAIRQVLVKLKSADYLNERIFIDENGINYSRFGAQDNQGFDP